MPILFRFIEQILVITLKVTVEIRIIFDSATWLHDSVRYLNILQLSSDNAS